MIVQHPTLTWQQLLELAQNNTPARRVRRPGQLPSTTPIPSSLHKLPPDATPPVLLYRDTNSWCPFCERVWFALEEKEIPFATEFIDLDNKPKWYTDLVPTAKVPAAKIADQLVYGSKDILLALEARFSDSPLLPADPQENAIALQLIEDAETNGSKEVDYKFLRGRLADADDLATLQTSFEAKLEELEQALATYPDSSYFLSKFSLVDIMYAPHLERLAVSLPVYRGYHIKGNPRFPNLNAWLTALNDRPAYDRVKTDATTFNLIMRRLWGLEPSAQPLPLDPVVSEAIQYRAEAAERLSDNYEAAITDILKNSGVQVVASGDISAVKDAIEAHLKLLAEYLLYGDQTQLPWGRVGGKENLDLFAAVGAIALAYVRNRICAPRDMSAGAAIAFRAATDKVLASIY